MSRTPRVATVIVPFHRNLGQLAQCLAAIRAAAPDAEVIVAADGARDDCHALASSHGARVIDLPAPPRGPAGARNRAADVATGDVLIFVDTDVVVAPDAIPRLRAYLDAHQDVAAVFGAYDEEPPERNFSSRYRNLSHSYVHQRAHARAFTFWAGLGAIRAAAFQAVNGFDERFRRPSIEDIELGYRLAAAGYELRVEPAARGRHLKRWTLVGGVVSDIRDRGVPWAQLILRAGRLPNDLNTTTALRASVVLAYVTVGSLLLAPFMAAGIWVALAALLALLVLNWSYYAWFNRRGGLVFAMQVVAVHFLHHLCNGISLMAGVALRVASRLGLQLPGALPSDPWRGGAAAGLLVLLAMWMAAGTVGLHAQTPDRAWVIDDAVLIDGTGAAPVEGSRVVGRGDRIVCAGPATACAAPADATIEHARGKWLIPGLIDTHVHLEWGPDGVAQRQQIERLALGITTTRDAGTAGQLETTLAARSRALDPSSPEPRLIVSGLVAPPDADRENPVAVAAFVRSLAQRGVSAIKIKQEFSAPVLQAIATEAHVAGLPVFGHTWGPHGSFLAAALDAGIDGVSHMYTFSEYGDRHDPARPPAPSGLAFWVWTEELWLYQDESRVQQAIDRLLQQRVWLEPLLVTEKHFTLPYPYPDDVAYLGEVRSLEQIARSWLPIGDSGFYRRRARAARIDAVYSRMCDVVRQVHARGGAIITGADESPAGAALLEEVSLLTGCGLTPMEALQAATQQSARALGLRDVGTIETGKRADLVLLDGNPLDDPANLRRASLVIKGGHPHDPRALLAPIVDGYTSRARLALLTRITALAIGIILVYGATRLRRAAPSPRIVAG